MARMDENGRIVIPKEIIERTPMLTNVHNENFFFFINDINGKIGITYEKNIATSYVPSNLLFLGNCDYDMNSKSFSIPENVELALGPGKDYYFFVGMCDTRCLYFAKAKLE